jgi:hypothetical protein
MMSKRERRWMKTAFSERRWRKIALQPLCFPKISIEELLRVLPRWNIGQLLVWIATKDPAAVSAAREDMDPNKPGEVFAGIPGDAIAALILEDRSMRAQTRPEEWTSTAVTASRSGRIVSYGRVNKQPLRKLGELEWEQFYIHIAHDWAPSVRWRHNRGLIEGVIFDAQSVISEIPAPPGSVNRKKRGPFPFKFEQIKKEMLEDINSGRRSVESLRKEKQQSLAKSYASSRETVQSARKAVLSEFEARKLRQNFDLDSEWGSHLRAPS